MYTRQEASLLNQQFWTSFGSYMSPVLSAEGEKINWVNYKTGVKNIRFTMLADTRSAKIAIVLSHQDPALQQSHFDKFIQLKKIFETRTGKEWVWAPLVADEHGKTVSEIHAMLSPVNVLNKPDWPSVITFFKSRLVALDDFWCEYKYAFEGLDT